MRSSSIRITCACALALALAAVATAREPEASDTKATTGKEATKASEPVRETRPPLLPGTKVKTPSSSGSKTSTSGGTTTGGSGDARAAEEPATRSRNERASEPGTSARTERAPEPAPEPMSAGDGQAMLAAHNAARANVSPAASPALPALLWSPELAALAQGWADGCPSGHNPNRQVPGLSGPIGENVAWHSAASPSQIVAMWTAEAADYDHAANACSGVCGHYTQVVWRNTTRVGCGARTGCSGPGGAAMTFYVCNYHPAGNMNNAPPY